MRNFSHAAIVLLCAICGLVSSVGGCATERDRPDAEKLLAMRDDYRRQLKDIQGELWKNVIRRIDDKISAYESGTSKEPPVVDYLIISGGGDWGAFGAGVLKGWGKVTDPAMKRPTFDVVTGVSTGALIAPFAFLGDDESLDKLLHLYCNPKPDWVRQRGMLFFLPSNPSLAMIDGLERDIRAEVDANMIHRIAQGARDNRVIGIGTTNADLGAQRPFILTGEAIEAERTGNYDRFQKILLASSAIPGAFPAVQIDDYLYIDGGTTSNILFNPDIRDENTVFNHWERLHPGKKLPKIRLWVIINNQFTVAPDIVQPVWPKVAGSGIGTVIRAATIMGMRLLELQVAYRNKVEGLDMEFRFISVPDDWIPPKVGGFLPETMQALAQMGERLGSDPASWKSHVPPQ